MHAAESIGTTEMVSRVVLQARRSARAGSELDEQAWFDAGEPDTIPNFARPDEPGDRAPRGSRAWPLWVGAAIIVSVGYTVGFYLGRG